MRISVKIIFILCFAGAYAQQRYVLPTKSELVQASYQIMLGQLGTTESGYNRGIMIDDYNRSIGNPLGASYCQAGQYWCYWTACNKLNIPYLYIPMPRNGLANSTFDNAKKHGYLTGYTPKLHDFIVWRMPGGYTGHIERITEVLKAGWVVTVGFNTSSGVRGSQDNGDGCFKRKRNIKAPLGRKSIRGLVGVIK